MDNNNTYRGAKKKLLESCRDLPKGVMTSAGYKLGNKGTNPQVRYAHKGYQLHELVPKLYDHFLGNGFGDEILCVWM